MMASLPQRQRKEPLVAASEVSAALAAPVVGLNLLGQSSFSRCLVDWLCAPFHAFLIVLILAVCTGPVNVKKPKQR